MLNAQHGEARLTSCGTKASGISCIAASTVPATAPSSRDVDEAARPSSVHTNTKSTNGASIPHSQYLPLPESHVRRCHSGERWWARAVQARTG